MGLEIKIMLGAAVFLGGFLWSYLFLRQFMYNFMVAFPLIKKMNALQPDLIAIGAKRYTLISVFVSVLFGGLLLFLVIHFCPLYLIIAFAVGAVSSFVLFLVHMSPQNKDMFDLFCNAYYRFVPDDELRTAIYNKDLKAVKSRLKAMEISGTFVPAFKK